MRAVEGATARNPAFGAPRRLRLVEPPPARPAALLPAIEARFALLNLMGHAAPHARRSALTRRPR
jgi:hypothetical protein